jgi:hypothetical protein
MDYFSIRFKFLAPLAVFIVGIALFNSLYFPAREADTSWSMMWRYWIRWPPLPRSRGIRSRWRWA